MFPHARHTLVGLIALAASTAVGAQDLASLRGKVRIDGSSTVYPITEAVAENFSDEAARIRVTVGVSGTGGGFKRFAAREIDISDASRPIKAKEIAMVKEAGVTFIELPVASDGVTIVVNPANDWVDQLSIDELKKIFLAEAPAKLWSDVRDGWPARRIKIFSPGTDSGTFDYFKEVIAGSKGAIRSDMAVSEDDNVLVNGVSGERDAMGFFGYAYYQVNKDKLRAIPIVNPTTDKAVLPTSENIESGTYAPFSRPLFLYVNRRSARRPEVRAFVEYYLRECPKLASEVGYVRLPEAMYERSRANFASRKAGTQFLDESGNMVTGALTKVYQ